MGLTVALEADIRGEFGRKARAEVVAVLDGNFDIGWSRNIDGSLDLIADLWGVAQSYDQVELITSINRQYAQNASSE